jgi:hypothetical protein
MEEPESEQMVCSAMLELGIDLQSVLREFRSCCLCVGVVDSQTFLFLCPQTHNNELHLYPEQYDGTLLSRMSNQVVPSSIIVRLSSRE